MGLFKAIFPGNTPLYVGNPGRPFENLGVVEGMFDYDGISISQSQALERAKTELRRVLNTVNADAAINLRYSCLSGDKTSSVLVYGDAVKFLD